MDFIGFLEMDDTEKESVCITCLFSIETFLAVDVSEIVGLTGRVEAVGSTL